MTRTPKLTDLQLILLTTAAQRPDGSLLPPPASVTEAGDRIRKAVTSLLKRGLAEEQAIDGPAHAWRSEGDAHVGVIISETGRGALGLTRADPAPDPEGDSSDSAPVAEAKSEPSERENNEQADQQADAQPLPAPACPAAPREGSKQAIVVRLLQQPDGASLTDLVDATGWLPHTTRAALTGLRKRGHAIISDKASGTMRYRIQAAA